MTSQERKETAPQRGLLHQLALVGVCAGSVVSLNGQEPREVSVIASVNGLSITQDALDSRIAIDLTRIESELYELRRREVTEAIDEMLIAQEASRLGIDAETLARVEIGDHLQPISEEDITAFYETNRTRLRSGPDMRQQIRQFLERERYESSRKRFVAQLRKSAKVVVNLERPKIRRLQLISNHGPARGPADAPVTIVAFSDFYCLYCRAAAATLRQVVAKYSDSVRVIHYDFPLDGIHPYARRVAEAARCADEQGRFWQFHDLAFSILSPQNDNVPEVNDLAKVAGIEDIGRFADCVTSGRQALAVSRSMAEGRRLGVRGTPMFLVNGRVLVGTQDAVAFEAIIDEELATVRSIGF